MKRLVFCSTVFLILTIVTPVAVAQTPAKETLTIEGQLVNATPGGTVGAGIPLMLHIYDGQQMTDMIHDVMTGPEGTFRFEEVEVVAGRRFAVMATIGQTTYFSELASVSPRQTTLELPITIYDPTTDASAIHVQQMHMLLDPLGLTQLQVTEIYIIANDRNRTVEEVVTLDDGKTASLRFTLPEGATGLSFEGNNANGRFIHTADGFADTWGVPPGAGTAQIAVRYLLPYQDGLRLEHPLSYPVDGLNVMVPQGSVSLAGETLNPEGSTQLQDGRTVDVFTAQDLPAGQSLSFELNGQPELSGQPEVSFTGASAETSSQKIGQSLVIIGLAVLGLALIGGGVWRWRQQTVDLTATANLDSTLAIDPEGAEIALIRAMAELDEAYQSGIIPEEDYSLQWGALRPELKALLTDPSSLTPVARRIWMSQ
jgi:hypothetical protein